MNETESILRQKTASLCEDLIKSYAKFLLENGIDEKTALEVARQTVFGSAVMMKQSGIHPSQLIDNVCSPGGTTVEGLLELKKNSFEKILIEESAK